MYLEIIGPPGAGKSTLFRRLITEDELFGGAAEDAVERLFHAKASRTQRLVWYALPSSVQQTLADELLYYRFANRGVAEFLDEHPRYATLVTYRPDTRGHNTKMYWNAVERYAIGKQTVRENESLCLDESFLQRACSLAWRTVNNDVPLDFIEFVPKPDVLIHVDAPTEVCLERQTRRDRETVNKCWIDEPRQAQEAFQAVCSSVATVADEMNIQLITIDNSSAVADAVKTVLGELPEGVYT
jgi:predicted kinase